MNRIDIGMSRATALKLAGDLYSAFCGEDPVPAGGLEFELEATHNVRGEQVTIRFSNDDMERDEITDQVYVEVD